MPRRGVIAAGHELTARAGARVLSVGGNAVDAAIAAVAMACVCEPVLCSPGGGGFAMVRDGADGTVRVLDAFPHTPRRRSTAPTDGVWDTHADFGTARQAFRIGPATSATPGLFDGLRALADRFGSAALSELVADAIAAARTGIVVTPFQHHLSTVVTPILTASASARSLFAPDGALISTGGIFRNGGLADALEILAREQLAGSAVGTACTEQQRGRGHVTADDLAAYEVVERTPIEVDVAGATVYLNPLPAAGGALVEHTLRQLSSTDAVDVAQAIAATGEARRDVGGDLAALRSLPLRRRGTTHVSVVDASGTACAVTVSNGEGNGEVVDGFGFMLNNVLGEDDVNPHGPDHWPLDTRLSSMMCPTMIDDADGTLTVLGSGGSSRIRSAISQVVGRLCLDGVSLSTAVDAPRVHVEDRHLDFETPDDDRLAGQLRRAFPDHLWWPVPDLYFGGVHAARLDAAGNLTGAGDARRAGATVVVDG